MRNLKQQLNHQPEPQHQVHVDQYAPLVEQVEKPKEYDYLDFEANERRLKELTQPGKLDRFKNLLRDDDIQPSPEAREDDIVPKLHITT